MDQRLIDSVRQQISGAAQKWYGDPDLRVAAECEIRPLLRRTRVEEGLADTDFRPTISFPVVVQPVEVLGRRPSDLRGLFFCPNIIRLNYIAHLSTTYMRVNVDAKHCRLSHALGTLSILSVLMRSLVQGIRDSGPGMAKCLPDPDEVLASFAYAALHDAFQGPFGHTLDSLRGSLLSGYHAERRLDKTFFNLMCGRAALVATQHDSRSEFSKGVLAFHDAVRATVIEPNGIKDPAWLFTWLEKATLKNDEGLTTEDKRRRRELNWLYELLEGPIDADRWDYLWRDTLHLGFSHDHDAIEEAFGIFREDVRVAWEDGTSHLCVSTSCSDTLAELFFPTREKLYRSVYEDPSKRLIDQELNRTNSLVVVTYKPPTGDEWATKYFQDFLTDFIHITDAELLTILERAGRLVAGGLVAQIVQELQTYPALSVAWREAIHEAEYLKLATLGRAGWKQVGPIGREPVEWVRKRVERGGNARDQVHEIIQYFRDTLASSRSAGNVVGLNGERTLALLYHCRLLPHWPYMLLHFERLVWKLTLQRLQSSASEVLAGLLRGVSHLMAERNPTIGGMEVLEALDVCPPIFVSFPWIPRFSEAAMREMVRDPLPAAICVRDANDRLELREPGELMKARGETEGYLALAGYPLFLVRELEAGGSEEVELKNTVSRAVVDILLSGAAVLLPMELRGSTLDRYVLETING